jgi:hypothetical protein
VPITASNAYCDIQTISEQVFGLMTGGAGHFAVRTQACIEKQPLAKACSAWIVGYGITRIRRNRLQAADPQRS